MAMIERFATERRRSQPSRSRSLRLDISDRWRRLLYWAERHAGLGGWVGAIGAIIAIFVTWSLARSEYLRTLQVEHARMNAEISLIREAAAEFDPIVQQYIKLYEARDPRAKDYYGTELLNDPRVGRMTDLGSMPITQWPSMESYDAFKRYLFASTRLLQTSVDANPITSTEQRIADYEGKLQILNMALRDATR